MMPIKQIQARKSGLKILTSDLIEIKPKALNRKKVLILIKRYISKL